MHEYLSNLLPRLKSLSKTLNQVEIFVDKEWVFLDEQNNVHEYTFLRDHRLIVAFNGQNLRGKWEILPTGKLLIDISNEIMILENAFVNKVVLVLKKNGKDDQPFILFDKVKIPDGNINRYLEELEQTLSLPENEHSDSEVEGKYSYEVLFYSFCFLMLILIFLFSIS